MDNKTMKQQFKNPAELIEKKLVEVIATKITADYLWKLQVGREKARNTFNIFTGLFFLILAGTLIYFGMGEEVPWKVVFIALGALLGFRGLNHILNYNTDIELSVIDNIVDKYSK